MNRRSCDCCGRCEHEHKDLDIGAFRVSEGFGPFEGMWWFRRDICRECWVAIKESVKRGDSGRD